MYSVLREQGLISFPLQLQVHTQEEFLIGNKDIVDHLPNIAPCVRGVLFGFIPRCEIFIDVIYAVNILDSSGNLLIIHWYIIYQ